MQLKVLSWNIWVKGHFDEMCNFLLNSGAGIIGLQEVQADDHGRDVIKYLTGQGYQHIFTPAQKSWDGKTWNDGPAIFSKHPIIKKETHILSHTNGRAVVRADIRVENKTLHVFSTHLVHTHQKRSAEQEEQIENLIGKLPNERTVLMGDFNATPVSSVIHKMKSVLVDSDPDSTPTWSVYEDGCDVCRPKDISIRLDYIFTSKDIKTSGFKVGSSRASDHLPISVNIEI